MARLTTDELIKKNEEEIAQQEENVRLAQNKLKKLKAKRKELLERQAEENQKDMLEQLKQLQITDPKKLGEILEQYYKEQTANNQEYIENGTSSDCNNYENSEYHN